MSDQSDALDKLEQTAADNAAADDAAEKLLLELVDLYKQAAAGSADPALTARINALNDAISARAKQLGAAVAAGTAAEPQPTGGTSGGGTSGGGTSGGTSGGGQPASV